MRILSVRLENIKSYANGPLIEFHPGVNFISGKNGSGKTTLLEAIGYALFNYQPYSKPSAMLREGAKAGTIEVRFTVDDTIIYAASRKILSRGQGSWMVREEGADLEDISGGDTEGWMKQTLGLSNDSNISDMFSQVIGVPQGEITTYFKMSSAANRKKHFDPILGTEDYKIAFTKSQSLDAMFEAEIAAKDATVREIRAKCEPYEGLKEELSTTITELADARTKYSDMCRRQEEASIKVNALEEIEDQIEELNQSICVLEEKTRSLEGRILEAERGIAESRAARETVDRCTEAYSAYSEAKNSANSIKPKLGGKKKAEDKKSKLENGITGEEESIKASRSAALERQQLAEETLRENIKGEEAAKAAVEGLDGRIHSMQNILDQHDEVQEKIDRLDDLKGIIQQNGSKVTELREENEELRKRIGEYQTEIADLPELAQISSKIASQQSNINTIRSRVLAFKQQKAGYENAISVGNICPTLNKPCKEINKTSLSKLIKDLENKILKEEKKLVPLEEELANLGEIKDRVVAAKGIRRQIEELEEEKSENEERIMASSSENEEAEVGEIVLSMPIYFRSLGIKKELKVPKAKRGVELLEHVYSKIVDLNDDSQQGHIEEMEDFKNERAARDQERKDATKAIKRAKEELEKIEKELNVLVGREDSLVKKREELESIVKQLDELKQLEEEVSRLEEVMSQNDEKYGLYIQNKQASDSLETRERMLVDLKDQLSKNQQETTTAHDQLNNLTTKFEEGEYARLKEELGALNQAIGGLKTEIDVKEKNIQKLTKNIAEMETELRKIEPIETELEILAESRDLAKIVRGVLNAVGPKISQKYLQSISAMADQIFNSLNESRTELRWDTDYSIRLIDSKGEREFLQLSGGEQMSAALAVQLALAKEFSRMEVAMFDEPTANLDQVRRASLAEIISKIKESYGFNQLFIISHDDTFSTMTERVIHLEKREGKTCLVDEV